MPVHLLSEANIEFLSIVDKGANRKRFFLRKAEGEGSGAEVEIVSQRLVKAEDWSCVYCVVAEPGWHESPGIAAADQSIEDRWRDEDEIRKAAHRFMKNGGAINRMHESIEPYGQLVENAIALADFTVDGETIRKGSWYVAIEPNADGRQAIEDGSFGGVSIQGTATRTLVEKGQPAGLEHFAALDELHFGKDAEDGCDFKRLKKSALNVSPKSNWVEEVGGLPKVIADSALHQLEQGAAKTRSQAIATAVNWAKKMCATGRAFGGKVKVSAKAQARACAGVAEWEAKKAAAHVTKQKVAKGEIAWETEEGSSAYLRSVEAMQEESLLKRIAKKLGISDEELAEIQKGRPTFSDRMAERELDDELPGAMDTLRSVIWGAFYPAPDDTEVDPTATISQALDEFKAWALDLVDRVPVAKVAEQIEEDADPDLEVDGEPIAKVRSYRRVVNGKTITVRAYDRNGGTGGLTRRIKTLNRGAAIEMPDGVKVHRTDTNFRVVTPPSTHPNVTTEPQSPAAAAHAVLNASAQSEHPKSLGGKVKFDSLAHYRKKKRVKKSEGSSDDPANVVPMSWTDEENERIEKIEESLKELTPDKIAKAIAEASKEPEAPTPEELKESVENVSKALEKVAEDVKKLGEGDSTQTTQPVQKTDDVEEGIFV